MEELKAWEKREDETDRAWQAFHDYLLLGSGRSLQKLIDHYDKHPDRVQIAPSKRLATLKKWSAGFDWQDRVRAYEDDLRAQEEQKWRDRRTAWREKEFRLKERLLERITDMLNFPLTQVKREFEREGDEGGTIIQIIQPARWTYKEVAMVGKLLVELGKDIFPADMGDDDDVPVEKRTITFTRREESSAPAYEETPTTGPEIILDDDDEDDID